MNRVVALAATLFLVVGIAIGLSVLRDLDSIKADLSRRVGDQIAEQVSAAGEDEIRRQIAAKIAEFEVDPSEFLGDIDTDAILNDILAQVDVDKILAGIDINTDGAIDKVLEDLDINEVVTDVLTDTIQNRERMLPRLRGSR